MTHRTGDVMWHVAPVERRFPFPLRMYVRRTREQLTKTQNTSNTRQPALYVLHRAHTSPPHCTTAVVATVTAPSPPPSRPVKPPMPPSPSFRGGNADWCCGTTAVIKPGPHPAVHRPPARPPPMQCPRCVRVAQNAHVTGGDAAASDWSNPMSWPMDGRPRCNARGARAGFGRKGARRRLNVVMCRRSAALEVMQATCCHLACRTFQGQHSTHERTCTH